MLRRTLTILSAPEYGLLFFEDEETAEISIQCLCGGMASWWRRVVLTSEEADEFRRGQLDSKRMMVEICREWHTMIGRIVDPIGLSQLSMRERKE